MKKSKKIFNENYLESEKSFNKFSLVLFERENFQNLKVMKVKKIFNKIIWKWKILQDLKVKIFRGETENFFTKSNLTLSISLSFSVRVDPHPT